MRAKTLLLPFVVGIGVGIGLYVAGHAGRARDPGTGAGGTPSAAPTAPAAPAGPHFRDVAAEVGVRFRHATGATGRRYLPETMGGGICWLDANGDGAPDLLCVQSGALPGFRGDVQPTTLFLNDGRGRFRGVPIPLPGAGYGMGACAADIDGDADIDVFVTAFGRNTLLRNRGDGTFDDVTLAARVGGDERWGSSACFLDHDRDGDLDLFVCNYLPLATDLSNHKPCVNGGHPAYCSPDDFERGVPPLLYRNDGDGKLTDVSPALGAYDVRHAKSLGVAAADLDGDDFPEIYVANDAVPSFLFRNRRDGTFEEMGIEAGCALAEEGNAQAGMGVEAADFDGDLDVDLFVTNYQDEYNALYRNDTRSGGAGALLFADASFATGFAPPSIPRLGFGLNLFDHDHDGRLDAFVANGHVMDNVEQWSQTATFAQRALLLRGIAGPGGAARFEDATDTAGGPGLKPSRVARGSAVADFDQDGDLDLAVAVLGGETVLLRAEGGPRGAFLILTLRGAAPNTSAVGARVIVDAGGRRQLRCVRAGSSYLSQDDLRLHFGLGAATRVDRIEVRWPSGKVDVHKGPIEASRALALAEGVPLAR